MNRFEEIKNSFTNIPDEVIRLWIEPISLKEGWPVKNGWDVRVTGEDFLFWNDSNWQKKEVDLSKLDYSRLYFDMIRGLLDAYIYNVNNSYKDLLGVDGKKRFQSALMYISKNGTFPQPPVLCVNEIGKYEILDGNHRFFAFKIAEEAYYEGLRKDNNMMGIKRPDLIQELWICHPNWSNSKKAEDRNRLRGQGLGFIID